RKRQLKDPRRNPSIAEPQDPGEEEVGEFRVRIDRRAPTWAGRHETHRAETQLVLEDAARPLEILGVRAKREEVAPLTAILAPLGQVEPHEPEEVRGDRDSIWNPDCAGAVRCDLRLEGNLDPERPHH